MTDDLKADTKAIKKILEAEYGKGKVSVTADHRGTGYGHITVVIKTPPSAPGTLRKRVLALIPHDLLRWYTSEVTEQLGGEPQPDISIERYYAPEELVSPPLPRTPSASRTKR